MFAPPPLSSPMSTRRDRFFLILTLFSSSILSRQLSSLPDPSFYDYLRESGLPAGIVPKGVTNFSIDVKTGEFTVALPVPCDAKFENQFHFEHNIAGVLSDGRTGNLSAVTEKELFLCMNTVWLDLSMGRDLEKQSIGDIQSIFGPPRNHWTVS